jgi:phosphate:Na+ symporter
MSTGLVGGLLGGLGLFLLGMTMMTDGLRQLAGPGLERILAGATRTRWHALGSGVLVTAVVQSSSAVTVAAIGFVNAGLLGLTPALWVLFGANVGTTMTGWIVALIGLKFKIEALALPLIGAGVFLRLSGPETRRGAAGATLAGFGLLFLGIGLLQGAFAGLAAQLALPQGEGALVVVAQVLAGALMTVLMQSSSASIAIALTAAQGGLLTLEAAAAVVIGANIGTTVTALLAVIGATPNARRAASAHVAFNALTGAVALLLLPWLVGALALGREGLGLSSDPAAQLALFHTVFNLLGVVLMWPLADGLSRWLQARFRAREEDEARPRYLDDNVLQVPALALAALEREVARMGQVALRMAQAALAGANAQALRADHAVLTRLDAAIQAFVEQMNRSAMTQPISAHLAAVLRVQRYHETTGEQALLAAALPLLPGDAAVAAAWRAFQREGQTLLAHCQAEDAGGQLGPAAAAMEAAYDVLKAALLAAGAAGAMRLGEMEEALRRCSALRRAAQQAVKAVLRRPLVDEALAA